MIVRRRDWVDCILEVDHLKLKKVKYLGIVVSEKNDIIKKVAARIQVRHKAHYGLVKLLSTRSLSGGTEKRL